MAIANKFLDIIDQNGRLNYRLLSNLASTIPIREFISYSPHPLLVGKELVSGILNSEPVARTQTISFKRSEVLGNGITPAPKNEQHTGIARAMFMFSKKRFSKFALNEISLGRDSANDLVVADFSISKSHAIITIEYSKYYITDLDSTNGTTVSGVDITPQVKTKLPVNSEIILGRLTFIFISAEQLYEMLNS